MPRYSVTFCGVSPHVLRYSQGTEITRSSLPNDKFFVQLRTVWYIFRGIVLIKSNRGRSRMLLGCRFQRLGRYAYRKKEER